jgi:hypothetical protein
MFLGVSSVRFISDARFVPPLFGAPQPNVGG